MTSSKHRHSRAPHRRSGASSSRHLRLQSTLFEELSLLFRGELSDPLLEGVHLTSLELSPDGRHARIGFTLPPDRHESDTPAVDEALGRAQGYLRSQLALGLNLKRVPHLHFICVGVASHELPPPPDLDGDFSEEGGES
jgi:ribosome-binding factor A